MKMPEHLWHLIVVCDSSDQLLNIFDGYDEFQLEGDIPPAVTVIAYVSEKVGG